MTLPNRKFDISFEPQLRITISLAVLHVFTCGWKPELSYIFSWCWPPEWPLFTQNEIPYFGSPLWAPPTVEQPWRTHLKADWLETIYVGSTACFKGVYSVWFGWDTQMANVKPFPPQLPSFDNPFTRTSVEDARDGENSSKCIFRIFNRFSRCWQCPMCAIYANANS